MCCVARISGGCIYKGVCVSIGGVILVYWLLLWLCIGTFVWGI